MIDDIKSLLVILLAGVCAGLLLALYGQDIIDWIKNIFK